ncbi:MAG: ATPase, partial [Gammaproteobacteria bacterium]|nr:ATPase [Gammaproteobacteria bacterium]
MPLSLRHKAVFGILLIEATLLLLLIWIGSNILVSAAARELMQRAQAAGQMLSASSKNAVLALDLADLNQQVADVLRQPGIAYVRIIDRKGRVL